MASLAERITKTSSLQTYITIKFLVDKSLVEQAFQAYAYLRWLDDQIDIYCQTKKARIACIKRQKRIIEGCFTNKMILDDLIPEEKMVVDLISSDQNKNSKLASFILNFFRVIAFDSCRKNVLIKQKQLDWYSRTVSVAVTDGIEYFINNNFTYQSSANQYFLAHAAHLSHMLRDYYEDLDQGFINISREYLTEHKISPNDTQTSAFRSWVKGQTDFARQLFKEGKQYIADLPVLRRKLAAYFYCLRFEIILDLIEKDNYVLRKQYPRQTVFAYLRMIGLACNVIARHFLLARRQTVL